MNIHSEYNPFPEGTIIPEHIVKVLGIHPEGFYFLAHDGKSIYYAASGSFRTGISTENIAKLFNRKKELGSPELDRILVLPSSIVLTPDELLIRTSVEECFNQVEPVPALHSVIRSEIPGIETSLLSTFSADILQATRSLSADKTRFEDLAAEWLRKVVSDRYNNSAHSFIGTSFFLLTLISNGKILLCNIYHFKDKSEFLYFFIGALKSCDLSPGDVSVKLSGEISPASPLAESLAAYFPDLGYDYGLLTGVPDAALMSSLMYPLF